jgi:hypothetical protein
LRERLSVERRTQSLLQVLMAKERKEWHTQEFSGPRARDSPRAISGAEECSPADGDDA